MIAVEIFINNNFYKNNRDYDDIITFIKVSEKYLFFDYIDNDLSNKILNLFAFPNKSKSITIDKYKFICESRLMEKIDPKLTSNLLLTLKEKFCLFDFTKISFIDNKIWTNINISNINDIKNIKPVSIPINFTKSTNNKKLLYIYEKK